MEAVDAATLGEAWLEVSRRILDTGADAAYDGLATKELALVTVSVRHPDPADELIGSLAHVYDEDFRTAVRLLGDGRVDADRIISHRVPLERVVEDGLHRLESAKDETLKILVKP